MKAASVTLNLNEKILKALEKQSTTAEDVEEAKDTKTEILQNIADIIALLGHASNEISLKRKIALSSVIKPGYGNAMLLEQVWMNLYLAKIWKINLKKLV